MSKNAYNKAGIPIPWDFRKERCVRTLVSFNPSVKDNFKKADKIAQKKNSLKT